MPRSGTPRELSENILKIVPAEVVVTYPTLHQILRPMENEWLQMSIAGLAALVMTIIIRRSLVPKKSRPEKSAIALSVACCILWIYTSGNYIFIEMPHSYIPIVNVMLVVLSVCAPFLVRPEKD